MKKFLVLLAAMFISMNMAYIEPAYSCPANDDIYVYDVIEGDDATLIIFVDEDGNHAGTTIIWSNGSIDYVPDHSSSGGEPGVPNIQELMFVRDNLDLLDNLDLYEVFHFPNRIERRLHLRFGDVLTSEQALNAIAKIVANISACVYDLE